MAKTHDLAVVVGEYQKDGQTKKKYENVGAVMESQNGPYILLKKTFNPAGVPGDKESIILSMFPVDQKPDNGFGGF
jgi:hypothetical protein